MNIAGTLENAVRLAVVLLASLAGTAMAAEVAAGAQPVYIGIDAEFGHQTSTSDDAVRAGILVAIDEINAAGGVLGGRPLQLVERDNRSVPARGVANLQAFAAMDDLVGVFCAKFSPVVIEELPTIHALKLPLLDPWAAANKIVDNGYTPNYVFRLSLRDGWAVPVMMNYLRGKGARRIGVLLPNTAWGRGNNEAVQQYLAANPEVEAAAVLWYNWGDESLIGKYRRLLEAGAEAVLLVANEREGSILVRELAAAVDLPSLPIASHWGVTGGDFVELTAGNLAKVDFAVVQTYSFLGAQGATAERVSAAAERVLGVADQRAIVSPVGVAHAYDLTHILARAVDLAGTTERSAVRDALERVTDYRGLIKDYSQPFTAERHEALAPGDVFMARYAADGALVPVR